MGESQSAPAPPPTATVKPRGSPLAAYILSSLEAAGYASDEAMDPADVNVAVFLLCEPGGIEASAAYVTKLRSGAPHLFPVLFWSSSDALTACRAAGGGQGCCSGDLPAHLGLHPRRGQWSGGRLHPGGLHAARGGAHSAVAAGC